MPAPLAPERSLERLVAAELGEAERLALAYAPAGARPAFRAVLALDGMLARVALAGREPLPAQLRLAWWREACARLPDAAGHPLLAALAEHWRAGPEPLVALVDAWEEIVAGTGGFAVAAEAVAQQRGRVLALCAGEGEGTARDAARAWTLASLADRAPDGAARKRMRAAARLIPRRPMPRALRPLAVLAGLSHRALATGRSALLGDRLSPLAALRLGIFGR